MLTCINWIIMLLIDKQTLSTFYGLIIFISGLIGFGQAFFGLSSKATSSSLFLPHSFNQSTAQLIGRELCELFSLPERQRRTCRQEKGVALTLVDAFKLSISECQRQFDRERWNCASLDKVSRINLLKHSFKETAFLFAISSSSLVHSFSRACSSGLLAQCSCDESLDDAENRRTWLWAGCGDNIQFGQKFGWKFMEQKKQKSKDLRALVDRHNTEVGIKVVKEFVQKRCKCHGISGTCTMKTCWKQLANFNDIGQALKQKYDRAVSSDASNDARFSKRSYSKKYLNTKSQINNFSSSKSNHDVSPAKKDSTRLPTSKAARGEFLGVKLKDLVYLDKSPEFCSKSKYSAGTRGRVCDKGYSCQVLCCGRGHNVQTKTVTSSCHCKVIWCCHVECQVCMQEKDVYTCK